MKTSITRRLLRTGAAFVATAGLVASGVLAAPSAHAVTVDKPLSLTAKPASNTVTSFGSRNIKLTFTGCYIRNLKVQRLVSGSWKAIGDSSYVTAGNSSGVCKNNTTTVNVNLLTMLGYDYSENPYKALAPGNYTFRITGEGWFNEMSNGEYWDVGNGASAAFNIKVIKARTTLSGWAKRTYTLAPGGAFTMPRLIINNPGGYQNLAILEVNYGFGWTCDVTSASSKCASSDSAYNNERVVYAARKMDFTTNWSQQVQFRWRVPATRFVTGGVSQIITVRFTKGAKATATRTVVKASGVQQYGKKQATLTAIVNQKKATGVGGFMLYVKSKYGDYERVYWPATGKAFKNGRSVNKFSKTVAKKGTYYLVGAYQSNAPKKFLSSMSKPIIFRIR